MKDRHAWNTWEGYCDAHDGYIKHFKAEGFLLEDQVVRTLAPSSATWVGELYCQDGIEIHTRKRQEARKRNGRLVVRTVEYSYHILLRLATGETRDILRYDNVHVHAHHNDAHHRHRYTMSGREIIEHIGAANWPTFSDVIKEAYEWWDTNLRTEA